MDIEVLIEAATRDRGEAENLKKLSPLAAGFSEAQLLKALCVWKSHLHPSKIPQGQQAMNLLVFQESANPALWSLAGLNAGYRARVLAGDVSREAIDRLAELWPSMFPWMKALYSQAFDSPYIHIQIRIAVMIAVTNLIETFSFTQPLWQPIVDTPGSVAFITRLWLRTTKNFSQNAERDIAFRHTGTSILRFYLQHSYLDRGLDSWAAELPNLMQTATLGEDFVPVVLNRFNTNFYKSSAGLSSIKEDVSLLDTLCDCPEFCYRFLSQKSMHSITGLLTFVVDQPVIPSQSATLVECINACLQHYTRFLEAGDGLSWVRQAVEAGLLSALVSAHVILTDLGQDCTRIYTLIGDILPKYLVYLSVIRIASRSLKKIDSLGLEQKTKRDARFQADWESFRHLVHDRSRLKGSLGKSAVDTRMKCENPKCQKSEEDGERFLRCSGCLEMYYCSRQCQSIDWKTSHRNICKETQRRRSTGDDLPLSTSDSVFINQVFRDEVVRHLPAILKMRIAQGHRRSEPTIVEMDYNHIPTRMQVSTPDQFKPMSVDLDSERDTRVRFEALLESARAKTGDDHIELVVWQSVSKGRFFKLFTTVVPVNSRTDEGDRLPNVA
ncbi:hypothetical protein PLICRDRAFT_317343 [Plicaturopsis crispa FD-325 SS-3]|nr:hypothetical protein PLICRDRAFT_317343 [Plicaturopsis crispa FD-325 SS-3]